MTRVFSVRRDVDDVDDEWKDDVAGFGVAWTFRWARGATYGGDREQDAERACESASEEEDVE